MNWLTVGVILFVFIMVAAGARKGIVRMVLSFAAVIAAVLIVSLIKEPVKDVLRERTPVYDSIEENVQEFTQSALKKISFSGGESKDEAVINSLPLPEVIRKALIADNSQATYRQLGVKHLSDYITGWLSNLLFTAFSYVLCFIVIWILLKVAAVMLNRVARVPVLNEINRAAGALIGFVSACLILWIGCIVITASASLPWGMSAMNMINESVLLSYIYNHNYLLDGLLRAF